MSVLLRNISPLGYLDLPLIRRVGESDVPGGDEPGSGCLIPGEEFEVSDEHAGVAPHWRPAVHPDDNEAIERNQVEHRLAPDVDPDGDFEFASVEVFDLGHGLLAQTSNFELVKQTDPLRGLNLDELKAYAAAQDPPIDLGDATTKAAITAAIRKG